MTTIGLCMIVKNEAKVILRCLDSVRPLLDFVLIEDTGSTDGTQTIIREWLDRVGLPGVVIDEPWRDFAHNRTDALAKLREHPEIDYAFMIDADDRIEIDAGFDVAAFKTNMTADFYDVEIRHGPIKHHRPQIYRNRLNFSYRGVVHEFVDAPEGQLSRATAPGFHMVIVGGGGRSQDTAKFQRDAALLERALDTEQDAFLISRYTFYLAQSYRDFGDKEKSLARYLARADMGFWDDEVYVSLNEAAKLQADAGRPADEVLGTYQRAIEKVPGRAEAFHGASLYCRLHGRNEEGFQIAKRGIALTEAPAPAGLFVQQWIYDYGLLDEYAVNAYWSGHNRECLDASLRILSHPNCPEGQRGRFLDNAKFAAGNLPREPNLGSLGKEDLVTQHALVPPRTLRSRVVGSPRVLVAILAKQKETSLPLYLECIEALDYPKSSIVLYIRTNNNTDGPERILREWVARVGQLYAGVEFDAEDVAVRVEQFGVHEWNATRFSVLGRIRNISLRRALEQDCEFYFVSDVDNFIRPCTLRELIALDLPIVAPLLRSISPGTFYANYHAEVDANGYYTECDQYQWILNRWVRGVLEVPVVHCTYLVRADVLNDLTYEDGSSRFEYVVFSDSARKAGVQQYIDNRQIYGYITFDEGGIHYVAGGIEQARTLLAAENGTTRESELLANLPAISRADSETHIREKFSEIYQKNSWGGGSGPGSLPINNIGYMEFVQSFIEKYGIKSVVDFGCGDWQFSRLMNWRDVRYAGFDLVPDVIKSNRRSFGRPGISFEIFKSLDEIPVADLLVCKDVFQHLPNSMVIEYISTFKRKFKFLLITNDDQPVDLLNTEIQAGGWRPILLDRPPFSESAPIVFSRTDTVGGWFHKATCLIGGYRDGKYLPSGSESLIAGENQVGLLAGLADDRVEDVTTLTQTEQQAKRTIRLKEFPPSSEISNTPPDWYIAVRDPTLTRQTYKISTDEHGFILPRSGGRANAKKIVFIGDSVVESMFVKPEHRFCSRLEDKLCDELGLDVTILNGGYGGATSLHTFNAFLNKLIPLRPAAVILMTGIVDADVAHLRASYWSRDCWAEPIVDTTTTNTWRDNDRLSCPSFDDRRKMLTMFATASELFDIPLWCATVPHRQVFSGEYVQKAFTNKADFDRQVDVRKQMNDVTRCVALNMGIPLFDLELELGARSDIFHDMFHLNTLGSEAVAEGLIKAGISDLLSSKKQFAKTIIRHSPAVVGATQHCPTGTTPASEISTMLGQVHLINLDRSTDRLATFKERNSHLGCISRVPAIDGALVDREELVKNGTITEDLPYLPGALGCALSHVVLWKKAVFQGRVVTIFEDDVICSNNFLDESARIVSKLPSDWDLIQWGYNFDPLFLWLDFGLSKANLRFYDRRFSENYKNFQCETFSSAVVRLVHSFGTLAYSVSPTGARALLERCLPLRKRCIPFPGTGIVNDDLGIDTAMCAAYGSMQAFICIPPLVIHDELQMSDRIARD